MKKLLILLLSGLAFPAIGELDALPRGYDELKPIPAFVDLEEIKQRGYIRVLTRNNPACYFMHRGQLMGFEYEMVHRFAKQHDLEVLLIVPDRWSEIGHWLLEGKADLIAACVTITPNRWANEYDLKFCHRYGEVFEEIIARADERGIQTLEDLNGRTIHVRRSSSYYETLSELKLKKQLKFNIQLVSEQEETFHILEKVGTGEYDLGCADNNFLDQSIRLGERLKPVLRLSRERTYGWVARGDQPELREAVNAFFAKEYKSTTYNIIYNRYFDLSRNAKLDEKFKMAGPGQISPYDDLVKKTCFDLRLPLDTDLLPDVPGKQFPARCRFLVGSPGTDAADAGHGPGSRREGSVRSR